MLDKYVVKLLAHARVQIIITYLYLYIEIKGGYYMM